MAFRAFLMELSPEAPARESRLEPTPLMPHMYNEYRRMYNECFRPLRARLERRPLNCCPEDPVLGRSEIYVHMTGEKPAAAVTLRGREIDGLAVTPLKRRRGLGREMLRFAVCRLRERDASLPVTLHVAECNEDALALYLSEGFTVTEIEIFE